MIRFRRLAVTAVCLVSLTMCAPVQARTKGETARNAYSVKLSRTTIKGESTEWFWFSRPVDLNDDGVPELVVSQLTSRPVIYSYFKGATRIVYQGNGDGFIAAYCPSAGVFAEVSGRMGYYRVWFCTFDGENTSVLCSYKYRGEPMGFSDQDYIFDNYDVTFYKGDSYTGEQISRRKFENLLRRTTDGAVFLPISSETYLNTEENRTEYILNNPTVTELTPVAQTVKAAENTEGGIKVTWDESPNADGYVVYRKEEGGTSWEQISVIEHPAVTSFTDPYTQNDDLNGTVFSYTVRGYLGDTDNQSKKYDEKGVRIMRLKSPGLTRCEAAPGGKAYISWDKNEAAAGYLLSYGTDPEFSDYKIEDLAGTDPADFTCEGLEEGKTYYFRVCSYCKTKGQTSYSAWSPAEDLTALK